MADRAAHSDRSVSPDAPLPRRPPAAPVFAACLSFSGGILLNQFMYKPAALYLYGTVAFAFCAVAAMLWVHTSRRGLVAYAAAVLAYFPAGALCSTTLAARPEEPSTILDYSGGEEVTLTGYVARSGSLHSGRDLRETLDLEVEQAQREGEAPQNVHGRARLSLYMPGSGFGGWESEEDGVDAQVAPPVFDYGQRLRLQAKLRPPVNYRNPGNMDYVSWLGEQKVSVLGSARSTAVVVLPGLSGSTMERLRWRARRSVLRQMEVLWPAPYAGLFQAMVLGERGLVGREQRTEFQRSGTFHLLVVSGMNVAVFAVFLIWALRRVRLPEEYAIVATIALTCGYAWLTELGAPILRSVLMIVAYRLAALLNRDRAPLNTVAVAALALVAWTPHLLFEASFQMTFLAVLTIGGLGVPLFVRTTLPLREALDDLADVPRDRLLRPRQAQLRLDLRSVAGWLDRMVGPQAALWLVAKGSLAAVAAVELAVLSGLMQVALTLPMAWYFHRVNVHAVWANMVVLPLTALLMPASMLAVALGYAAHWLAWPFALAARCSLQGILWAVHGAGGAQLIDRRIPMPAWWTIAFFAAAYGVALLCARRHRLLLAVSLAMLGAAAFVLVTMPRAFAYHPGELEITAIDIGQGDSFLLVTPHGRTLLMDSGGLLGGRRGDLDIGEDVVSPYLWQRGLARLDVAAFSHSHSDHIGGMAAVLHNFHPQQLWYGPNYPSHEVSVVLAAADASGAARVQRKAGERFAMDGVEFEVLSPPADWVLKPRGQDDSSMVLRVSYAGRSVLLAGDIHRRMERILAEEYGAALHVDLLKVPHHGSATSTSAELLDAVRPQWAVLSCGVRNPFRHPRPEVIGRLAAEGARVYRTDLFGPVTFYLDAAGVHPSVAR
ncbi:MAG: ComEC/Rec2 family competence protein [Acidobacteriota bacterium]|nr:ComEC/Rec2 family competence protein [Acidobacteriota bacterium]